MLHDLHEKATMGFLSTVTISLTKVQNCSLLESAEHHLNKDTATSLASIATLEEQI